MQVLGTSNLCGCFAKPSAFLVLTVVDPHEVDAVEVDRLSLPVDGPGNVNAATLDVGIGVVVDIAVAERG